MTDATPARLLEPLGLLRGRAAAEALAAGLAWPLAGGPDTFSLARLHPGGRVVAATAIPDGFADALKRVCAPRPPWAGLPSDRPLVMGIINVTPDSFSDGGDHADPARAIAAGRDMAAAGADIVDVGGESTRPGSPPLDPAIEQVRILPIIRALAAAGIVVSVDTRFAATMAAALDAGARIVNDVSGFAHDPASAALVRRRGCPVVAMHMRGTPLTMQSLTDYADVVVDVTRELAARLDRLDVPSDRVMADPGIGFAKGAGHNEALLARLPLLLNLGVRLLVGVSRKGFVGRIVREATPKARGPGSLAGGLLALCGGASILRVHDVPQTVQAVRVWQAVRTADPPLGDPA